MRKLVFALESESFLHRVWGRVHDFLRGDDATKIRAIAAENASATAAVVPPDQRRELGTALRASRGLSIGNPPAPPPQRHYLLCIAHPLGLLLRGIGGGDVTRPGLRRRLCVHHGYRRDHVRGVFFVTVTPFTGQGPMVGPDSRSIPLARWGSAPLVESGANA